MCSSSATLRFRGMQLYIYIHTYRYITVLHIFRCDRYNCPRQMMQDFHQLFILFQPCFLPKSTFFCERNPPWVRSTLLLVGESLPW
jgi:hypothetical protein